MSMSVRRNAPVRSRGNAVSPGQHVTPSPRVRGMKKGEADDDVLSAKSLSRIQARTRFPDFDEFCMRAKPQASSTSGSLGEGSGQSEFVAPWLGRTIFRAYAELDGCPQLDAVWAWLGAVKSAYQFPTRPADVDLENGVALLEAMAVICHESGLVVPEPEADLDENGAAVRRNVKRLRDALQAFRWEDHHQGAPLKRVNFKKVQRKGLCGFVVLAAALCPHKDRLISLMESLSEFQQMALEDLIHSAMVEMGMTLDGGDDATDGTADGAGNGSAPPAGADGERAPSVDSGQSLVTASPRGSSDGAAAGGAAAAGGRSPASYEQEIAALRREVEELRTRCMEREERALALETVAAELSTELGAAGARAHAPDAENPSRQLFAN